MAANGRYMAVGVFDSRSQAESAVEGLRRAGFTDEQIGVAARGREEGGADAHTRVEDGAATGAVGGGTVGALAGIFLSTGAIPAVGPVLAGGLLAGVLASAALGAAAGGLLGGLIGLGIPEEEARYYEGDLRAGRTLVTVRSEGRYDEAVAVLRRCGAYDTANAPAGAVPSTGR